MKRCDYYAFGEGKPECNACSRSSDRYPLMVNCAGCTSTGFSFTTDNPGGREDYYLLWMLGGRMSVRLPDGDREAMPGSAVLFPPHYHYRYRYDGGEELCYLWIHFTGSHVAPLLEEYGLSPLPGFWQIANGGEITGHYHSIFDAFLRGESFRDRELSAHLELLLLSLARCCNGQEIKPPRLFRSLQYIHAFFHTPITLSGLARMENLSVSRYGVLFGEETGTTPFRYITGLRMQCACKLLTTTDMSIGQVGLSAGYQDVHFFCKCFKAHTGMTPTEYRNAQ